MEKMDSVRKCAHEKIFSAIQDRAFRPWICQLCGEEGEEPVRFDVGPNEYEALRFKKRSGGFRGPQ